MGEERDRHPVNVDIGLSAKAEIKGEIPSGSMGRLFDAVTDAIRPFTEERGLRADQIRLQREDVLIAIAKKAAERLRIENVEISPVKNKILVPLLEKSSLEDINDEFMLERWASLLAASATDEIVEPRLVSILSELSSKEAMMLEDIFYGISHSKNEYDSEKLNTVKKLRGSFNAIIQKFDARIVEIDFKEISKYEDPLDHVLAYIDNILSCKGIRSTYLHLSNIENRFESFPTTFSLNTRNGLSIDILKSIGLLDETEYKVRVGSFYIEGKFVQLSTLGLHFLSVCSFNIRRELRLMLDTEESIGTMP